MTTSPAEPPAATEAGEATAAPTSPVTRAAVVVVAGLGAGTLTSVLQAYLNFPWLALVNSASPWLAVAFAAGAMYRGHRAAALAGLVTCVGEMAGYYLTAAMRGYQAGSGFVLFWAACGLVGGPRSGGRDGEWAAWSGGCCRCWPAGSSPSSGSA